MTVLSEGNNFRDIVRYEGDNAGRLSRIVVTVVSGLNLLMGMVLGMITKSTPTTGTAAAGNTGGGTVGSVTAGAKAKIGEYQIKCVAYTASPLAATFEVTDPDGVRLPDASLAAYVSDAINFDIADGSPDIAVGDIWTITIVKGSEQVKGITPGAVDGTQDAYGILTADCDATLAAKEAVAVYKDAVIIEANLVWPVYSPAITTPQKAVAVDQLKAKGIVARLEA